MMTAQWNSLTADQKSQARYMRRVNAKLHIQPMVDHARMQAMKPRESRQERVIHDQPVKRQFGPFFEVKTKGTTVEYTDNRNDAYSAYFTADAPKEVVRIDVVGGRGFRRVVESQSGIVHRRG